MARNNHKACEVVHASNPSDRTAKTGRDGVLQPGTFLMKTFQKRGERKGGWGRVREDQGRGHKIQRLCQKK